MNKINRNSFKWQQAGSLSIQSCLYRRLHRIVTSSVFWSNFHFSVKFGLYVLNNALFHCAKFRTSKLINL